MRLELPDHMVEIIAKALSSQQNALALVLMELQEQVTAQAPRQAVNGKMEQPHGDASPH